MNRIVTQRDIEVLMQSDKVLFYKLELLNSDMKILDLIQGNLISDSISISADSDVRRIYNCELLVTDSSFDIGYDKKIFINRRIRPYIGVLHQRSGEIIYYLIGTFLFNDTNFNYDEVTKTLSLTCNDLMCLLNGTLGGNLDSYKRTIKAKTSTRSVIIETLKEVGINNYLIEFNLNNQILYDFEIPYDLTYEAGMTAYQIIKDIIDLYPGTQCYFDVNGTFIINRIPTGENEQVVLNDEIIQPILINEQSSMNFANIFNEVEIWGKLQDPEYYSKSVTYSNGVYYCNAISYKFNEETGEYEEIQFGSELNNFDTFSFKMPHANTTNETYLNINNTGNILVVKEDGKNIDMSTIVANTDYVFRYRKSSNDFLYLGQYQAHARMYVSNNENNKDANAIIYKDSDYAIEKIGHKLKVFSDNTVSNIFTDELCRQRCKYELWNSINQTEQLNLSTICIPWLDVNCLIEFTSKLSNTKNKYMIDNIDCNFADHTMNLSLHKYYAEYIKRE